MWNVLTRSCCSNVLNLPIKIFLNHIVIFMLIGGNLRSRKSDMNGQEWVFVTLVTLHIITL